MKNAETKTFVLDSKDVELTEPEHKAELTIAEYEGQNIGVAVVDAREKNIDDEPEGRTILWPQSFDARLDRFEMQRMEVIAQTLNARVVAVEAPGVGGDGAKSTFAQKYDLAKRGSFDKVAHAQLGAMKEVVEFEDDEDIEMLLYSQGAAQGAAMIEQLANEAHNLKIKVPRVAIIEAVNDHDWKLLGKDGLLAKIGQETNRENVDRYLKENDAYDFLVPPTDRTEEGEKKVKKLNLKQTLSRAAFGLALRKGFISKFEETIKESTSKLGIKKIDFIRANGSEVARKKENEETVRRLKLVIPLAEVALTEVVASPGEPDHHHPFVHSMSSIKELVEDQLK